METRDLIVLEDVSLITCVVQQGKGDIVAKAARDAGAQGATSHYARGMGVRERLGLLGVAVSVEKEVVTIIVSDEQLERVFRSMYLAGNLDTPGMGIIYVTKLEKVATHIPQDILDKLDAAKT